jgi:hypothetical protein
MEFEVKEIDLLDYQDEFVFSEKRFPAIIAGVGTGKTYMLLLKIWNFCDQYPNSLALVVRKEFTDLRDSTMKDFEKYFNVTIDSHKEYRMDNGSIIMFRHGDDLNVLKNINLSIFGIEQAEEFPTEETFDMLRDRLRRQNAPLRQGCIIANANGHNWIWKRWINNPPDENYHCVQATTFDNAANLPLDFVEDLKRKEIENPQQYKRFVMNCHEVLDGDDLLLNYDLIQPAVGRKLSHLPVHGRMLTADIARYGDDESVFGVLEARGLFHYELIHIEAWLGQDTMKSVGKIVDMMRIFKPVAVVVDDDGIGGGVTDRLVELKKPVIPFKGGTKARNEKRYANTRTEGYFKLKELFDKGYITLPDDAKLNDQLMTIRYRFKSFGQVMLVPKEEMRKEGIASPDRADMLMMGVYHAERIHNRQRFYDERVQDTVDSEYNVFA